MLSKLNDVGSSRCYWIALILLVIVLEGVALYYQHVLDIRPCVVCIHVRIWLMLLLFVAVPMVWLTESTKAMITGHVLVAAIMGALLERSYELLGTERGWIFGSCDFDIGLPAWLDLQNWWPFMFKIWESCGYTPELLFGITMAEALLVMSSLLLLTSILFFISIIYSKK